MNHKPTQTTARLATLCAALLALASTQPLAAQPARDSDPERQVRRLITEGKTAEAVQLIEQAQTDDPLVRIELQVWADRIRADDRALDTPDRIKAVASAVAGYESLFELATDRHWKSPVWKADLAEFLLDHTLRGDLRSAPADFVEFGEPTTDQEQAFKTAVARAATVTEEASRELFHLISDLPRQADFVDLYEITGRWDTLVQEYQPITIPFYRALAIHDFAMTTPEPSPDTLKSLAESEAALARLLDPETKLSPAGLARTHILVARIRLQLGRAADALTSLDAASNIAEADPADRFLAQLTRQQSLAQLNRKDEALTLLRQLANDPHASGSPLLLILIHDARRRITGDDAEYTRLLDNPSVASSRDAIRAYLYQRKVEREPIFIGAAVEVNKRSNLHVLAQADAWIKEGAEKGASGGPQFAAAVAWLTALINKSDLPPTDEAAARTLLGLALFRSGKHTEAVRAWRELGQRCPGLPEGEAGAVNAFKVAKSAIYSRDPSNPETQQFYLDTLLALLEKYPHAHLAPNEPASLLWYEAAGIYLKRKEYDRALTTYVRVTPDHPFYPDAQYESLFTRYEQWRAADGESRTKIAELFPTSADRAILILTDAAQSLPTRADKLSRLAGDALLMRDSIRSQSLGEGEKVVASLADFETRYARFPDLLARKRRLLVTVLLSLDRAADAKAEVERLKQSNPDEAGPLVREVLESLHARIQLAQAADPSDPRIPELRDAALQMARDLLEWASNRPDIAADPEKLLYFQNLYGRELIATDKLDDALKLYSDLFNKDFGDGRTGADQLDVLLGLGLARFHAGDLDNASGPLNSVINRGVPDSQPWWEAWSARIQLLDTQLDRLAETDPASARSRRTREIYLAIKKLEQIYPALGGPAFEPLLARLRNKSSAP